MPSSKHLFVSMQYQYQLNALFNSISIQHYIIAEKCQQYIVPNTT